MNIVQPYSQPFLPVSDPDSVRPTAPGLRSEDRHAREDGPFLPGRHPAQHRVHVSILYARYQRPIPRKALELNERLRNIRAF